MKAAQLKTGKMRSHTRILVVDDHPVVRKGIRCCLARHSYLLIVGEAADGHEAVAKAKELLPDIVLLDINLPQLSGLEVAEVLHKDLPNIKVLILSMYQRAENLAAILQSGAQGYVFMGAPPEELVKAIETVTAGECYFSPEIIASIRAERVHSSVNDARILHHGTAAMVVPEGGSGGVDSCVPDTGMSMRVESWEQGAEQRKSESQNPNPETQAKDAEIRKNGPVSGPLSELGAEGLKLVIRIPEFEINRKDTEVQRPEVRTPLKLRKPEPLHAPFITWTRLSEALVEGNGERRLQHMSSEFLGPRSPLPAPSSQLQAAGSLPRLKFVRSRKFTIALLIVLLLALSAAFHIRP